MEDKAGIYSMDIQSFWEAVLKQDAKRLTNFFASDAYINWHCTNEHFTVEEYIRVNCEYTGDRSSSFHVVLFMQVRDGKNLSLDEYWGDDGAAS